MSTYEGSPTPTRSPPTPTPDSDDQLLALALAAAPAGSPASASGQALQPAGSGGSDSEGGVDVAALIARLDARRGAELRAKRQAEEAAAAAAAAADRERRQRLAARWARAAEEAAMRGLPIVFHDVDDPETTMYHLAMGASEFYVGGTGFPSRRWLGDAAPRTGPYDRPRPRMLGHRASGWNVMHVVALEEGDVAKRLEARLISLMRGRWREECKNVAVDSRGLAAETDTFVYICTS